MKHAIVLLTLAVLGAAAIADEWSAPLPLVRSVEQTGVTADQLPYSLTNATVKLNRSVQSVTVASGGSVTVQLPDEETGKVRDFVVYANCAADNTALNLPAGTYYAADASATNALKSGVTALYFSELTTGIFAVGRVELSAITVQ